MGRGGGGGGGGGGGRSSGGSFGGSRSSGGRSGGSFSSGRSGGSFGGSFSGSRGSSTGGSFAGGGNTGGSFGRGAFFGWPRTNPVNTTGTGTRPTGGGASQNSGCSRSFLFIFVSIIFIVIFVVALIFAFSSFGSPTSGTGITKSTFAREPLPSGAVEETRYYTDELGWIANETKLLDGMRHFYKKTGVQPHLYITDIIDGERYPTEAGMDQFANSLYDVLFDDEAHLLLVFFEYNDNYMTWYVAGSQAKTVVDQEGADILLDYVDKYYYSDMSDEEFFSKAFEDAADRMMTVTRSPWIPVFIVFGIGVVLLVAFIWWQNAKAQKNLEAKQTEAMLKTPIEQFGDKEAEDLAKKYQDEGTAVPAEPVTDEIAPIEPEAPLEKYGDKEAEELARKYEEGFRKIEPEGEAEPVTETFADKLKDMTDEEVEALARKYTEDDNDQNQG